MQRAHINFALLGKDLRDNREAMELGVREYGKLIGLSPASVSRIEQGHKCDADAFAHVSWYLGFSPNRYLVKP